MGEFWIHKASVQIQIQIQIKSMFQVENEFRTSLTVCVLNQFLCKTRYFVTRGVSSTDLHAICTAVF